MPKLSLAARAAAIPRTRIVNGRLHWEPSKHLRALGYASVALGPINGAACDKADALNDEAGRVLERRKNDQAVKPAGVTVKAVIVAYLASHEFAERKAKTQQSYTKHIAARIEPDMGDVLVASLTKRAVHWRHFRRRRWRQGDPASSSFWWRWSADCSASMTPCRCTRI